MASAQLTEEQLQQSAVLSEEDVDYDDTSNAPAQGTRSPNDISWMTSSRSDVLLHTADDDRVMRRAMTGQDGMEMGDGTDVRSKLSVQGLLGQGKGHTLEEDVDVQMGQNNREVAFDSRSRSSSPLEELDVDEDDVEGVGAVKIRPGETDDDGDDLDSEHSDSQSDFDNESDGAAAWDNVAEGDDIDEGSEDGEPNPCTFCKQDEEHDPGEDFEEYLICLNCGTNAHQFCAREAGALTNTTSSSHWTCADCALRVGEPSKEPQGDASRLAEIGGRANTDMDTELSPSPRISTAPQVARDLLPPHKGANRPDSHLVFNQLVVDSEPMDGSRILRKRKTSSVADDDMVMSIRKRTRNASRDLEPSHGAGSRQGVASVTRDKETRRKLRLNPTRKSQAVTITRRHRSVVVKIRVEPTSLRRVLAKKAVSSRNRKERGDNSTLSHPDILADRASSFVSSDYSHPFYAFFDRETDDMRSKPYGGILSESEADTSRTLPTNDDRRRFDEAKQRAEEVWRARLHSTQVTVGTFARRSKKTSGPPASQIECIDFGGWEIDTWYAAPYPEEYSRNRTLYICEFCLKYMNSDYVAWRHKLKCPAKHPPGDEIYRHGSISVYEVDGRKNPVYCQNLCLLAKLFLGSKTLYYDVEPFLFYVLCEYDALGYHFVGYFSKEKRASSQNNVSCILTLPIHQRKGYGNLLIDFSYLLTRVERKTGSPEKPLSDMGLVSYRNYWRLVLCRYLLDHLSEDQVGCTGLSIRQISDDTGLTPDDVISALEGLRCLVRDPLTELYAFRVDLAYCTEYVLKWERKDYVTLNPDALTWTPYVMGRGNATNFELGPAISAIAPREEEDTQRTTVEPLAVSLRCEGVSNSRSVTDLAVGLGVAEDALALAEEIRAGGDWGGARAQPEPEELADILSHRHSCGDDMQKTLHQNKELDEGEETDEVGEDATSQTSEEHLVPSHLMAVDWTMLYRDLPPSRFEVFPPPGGRRAERSRNLASRPALARSASTGSRPRRTGVDGSARRLAASRPKSSSSSRRKSGGTGRGPGRWPKGTKKSDYGNADSGPGLPPAWIKERARLAAGAAVAVTDGEVDGVTLDSRETIDVARVQFGEAGGTATAMSRDGSSVEGLHNEVEV